MADVFISYSQKDRAVAQRLAESLKARGVDVWWDTDIVGGEQFREAIMRELQAAKVALVLWSTNSVGSRFVLDEADHAAASGKLISVLTEGFQPRYMPMGFGGFQAVPIEQEDRLVAALQKRGLSVAEPHSLQATAESQSEGEQAAWDFVIKSSNIALLDEFLRRYPKRDAEAATWEFVVCTSRNLSMPVNPYPMFDFFLSRYPKGRYASTAQDVKDGISWGNAYGCVPALVWFVFGFYMLFELVPPFLKGGSVEGWLLTWLREDMARDVLDGLQTAYVYAFMIIVLLGAIVIFFTIRSRSVTRIFRRLGDPRSAGNFAGKQ